MLFLLCSRIAFRDELPVSGPGVLVSGSRLRHLVRFDETLLLFPAAVYAVEAPLRAASRGPDRLAIDEDKDRVGMRRGKDSQSHPTAFVELRVERNIANVAVCFYFVPGNRVAVNNKFDRDTPCSFHAGAFDIPIRVIGIRSLLNIRA